MLGYVKRRTEYYLGEVLMRRLGGMIVDAGHVMPTLQKIPLEVLQPEPMAGRREGTHEQYAVGIGGTESSGGQQTDRQKWSQVQLHLQLKSQCGAISVILP